jgi:hypothetical protein
MSELFNFEYKTSEHFAHVVEEAVRDLELPAHDRQTVYQELSRYFMGRANEMDRVIDGKKDAGHVSGV